MLPLSSLYYVILMHNSLLFPALSDFISLVHGLEEPVFNSDSACAAGQKTLLIRELPGWGSVLHPQAELQIQKLLSPGIPAVCHQGQSRKNRRVSICGTRAVIFCHKFQVFMQKIYRKWNIKEKKILCEHLTYSIIHKQGFPAVIPHRENSKESSRCSLRVSWSLRSKFAVDITIPFAPSLTIAASCKASQHEPVWFTLVFILTTDKTSSATEGCWKNLGYCSSLPNTAGICTPCPMVQQVSLSLWPCSWLLFHKIIWGCTYIRKEKSHVLGVCCLIRNEGAGVTFRKGLQGSLKASGNQGSCQAETREVQNPSTKWGKGSSELWTWAQYHYQSSVLELGVPQLICVFWELLYEVKKR